MTRRWDRTAVDVLLSDCQYRKGTAQYGQCGVWNTINQTILALFFFDSGGKDSDMAAKKTRRDFGSFHASNVQELLAMGEVSFLVCFQCF